MHMQGALPAVKPPTHAQGNSPGARPALQAHRPAATSQQPFLGSHPFDEDALEAEEAAAEETGAGAAAVVFQRAQALLPQLEVRMREVQAALGAAGQQGKGTLQLCGTIKTMCEVGVAVLLVLGFRQAGAVSRALVCSGGEDVEQTKVNVH